MTKLDDMDMPSKQKLIGVCCGLVVMDDVNKNVRLTHFAAQGYLDRKDIIPKNSVMECISR
jgi:hypothetical protein